MSNEDGGSFPVLQYIGTALIATVCVTVVIVVLVSLASIFALGFIVNCFKSSRHE